MVKVRAARPAEAEDLTGLVMRSKAHWGYDAVFMAACAQELRIRSDDVTARHIVVAENERGEVLGVASWRGPRRGRSSGCSSWSRRPSGRAWAGCCTGTCCGGRWSWGPDGW